MVHFISRWLLPAALLAAAPTAQAQSAARTARADPLDPKASVPAPIYASSFSQYRRLDAEKPISWREANDAVTRIGGWRAYAREAQQPEAAVPAQLPPAALPAAATKPTPVPVPMPMQIPMPQGPGGPRTP
jgi:hypothetical protein